MSAQNSTKLIGRVGNIEEKMVPLKNGETILKLEISLSQSNGKDKEGNWLPSSWYRAEVWGGQAEYVQKYAPKGSVIAVEGKLIQQTYEDASGNKREKYFIKVNDRDGVYVCKSSESTEESTPEPSAKASKSTKKPIVDLDTDELPPF